MSFFKYLPTAAPPVAKKAKPKQSKATRITNALTKKDSSGANRPKPFISADASSLAPQIAKKPKAKALEAKQKRGTTRKDDTQRETEIKIDVESCDILFIDEQIKRKLSAKISTLKEMQQDLINLLWILKNSEDPVDRIGADKESALLRRSIKDIEGGFELGLYLLRTTDMLEEYRTIISGTAAKSFIRDLRPRDDSKIYRKNQIILEFLRISKQYVNLENFRQKQRNTPICDVCHNNNLRESDDNSIYVCKCGNQIEVLDDAPTFKDSERVNMSTRYTYTCRGHFNEAMNRFEGKQNTEIAQGTLDILIREMQLHGLSPKTFSKDHLYMFLSENKLSDFYADINLIFFLITKINPPDITKYRNELLEMFDQLEEAYKLVKDDDRLNSLNVNWKLYKLLQLLDYPCKKDDFFCLKTPTKQGEHEEKWHAMIEYLRSQYPNVNTSFGKRRWRHVRTL
jgi:hypothetical protein